MSGLRALTLPKWGIEMTEGILAEWGVEEGEAFTKGHLLASIETDKIVNDIEADFDSALLRKIAEAGDTCVVGELIAVLGETGTPGAEIDAFVAAFVPADTRLAGEDGGNAEAEPPPQAGADETESLAVQVHLPEGVAASPLALKAAAQLGVDLAGIEGSGRAGRIQKQDVEQAAQPVATKRGSPVDNRVDIARFADVAATDVAKQLATTTGVDLAGLRGSGKSGRIRARDLAGKRPAESPARASGVGESVPFSRMRAQIAKRLTAAYREIPHYYLETEVQMDALLALRASWNRGREPGASLNDFIVRAAALTLREHPAINVQVGDNEVVHFAQANIALAVAIADGLITPVVKAAGEKSLADLCAESRRLIGQAKSGGLTLDDLSGATFTVSNLGMFGVTRFTAIINPPQAAILAVGATRRVAVEADGGIVFGTTMTLTLGCDHRVIDGAIGGRFLADLKARLEAPAALAD